MVHYTLHMRECAQTNIYALIHIRVYNPSIQERGDVPLWMTHVSILSLLCVILCRTGRGQEREKENQRVKERRESVKSCRSCQRKRDSLSTLIEEHSRPAVHESWLPGEPQDHQQGEDGQHRRLRKRHATQLLVLLLHHFVRFLISVFVHATTK